MKTKIVKKYLNLISIKNAEVFKDYCIKEVKIKPYIKGKYYNKVFKKGCVNFKKIVVKIEGRYGLKTIPNFKPANHKISLDNLNTVSSKFGKTNVFYTSKETSNVLKFIWLIFIGLIIGFINGFWGGGGGMVCVPTLTILLNLPDKKAHATAILIMLPLSLVSFGVYLFKGSIDMVLAGIIAGGFTVGGILGALLLKKTNNLVLQIMFAIVIILGAIKILL